MKSFALFAILFNLVSVQASKVDPPKTWDTYARRLTGESDVVRAKALHQMRSMKNLDDLLRIELKKPVIQKGFLQTEHFLAFDVITSLERQSLFKDLISDSVFDETGYSYHAMNTLLNANNGDAVIEVYRQRLMSPSVSTAAKLALLDTLARVGFELSVSDLRVLKKTNSNQEKSSILSYVRTLMLSKNRLQYNQLLPEFLKESSVEIKMQTLFLIDEVFKKRKLALNGNWPECQKESSLEVKKFCFKLSGRPK